MYTYGYKWLLVSSTFTFTFTLHLQIDGASSRSIERYFFLVMPSPCLKIVFFYNEKSVSWIFLFISLHNSPKNQNPYTLIPAQFLEGVVDRRMDLKKMRKRMEYSD